jgi:hypothetical protein
VEDGFDVVVVRIEHERSVVAAAVLGSEARRSVVGAATANGCRMPAFDTGRIRRPKRDVRAGRHAVSAPPAPDLVSREVFARAASEQDVRIAFDTSSPSTAKPSSASAAAYMRRLAARSLTRMPTWSSTSLSRFWAPLRVVT